jgi:hypothetical protein
VRGQRAAIERTVLTDFAGAFRLDDLEPDLYRLGISQVEHLVVHNQWLELTTDREMVIRLTAATVGGTVRDAQTGEAVAGALIRLQPTEGPEFLILDSSHADGSFHLLRVPPGGYHLSVSAEGFVGAEQTIRVAAGEAVSGLDFALQPTTGGLLQVRLANGGVPPIVHLLALNGAGVPVVAETRAPDASGQVWLATLPPGSWQLVVSAPAAATSTQSVVVPGEAVSVVLPPASSLHVRVPALQTTDLLANVTLLAPNRQALWILGPGGKLQGRWSMAAGQATIEGVPQGTWLLHVESSDGRVWNGNAVSTGDGATALTLAAPDPTPPQ